MSEQEKLEQLSAANGPDEIREALKNWTPEELAQAGIL